VLLVHGVTGYAEQWGRVMPLLAGRGLAVLAPDLVGHGHSAKPRGDYSLGAYASGLRDLVVALGHERVTVVGHSLGGGIAMQFAYQFPERTERLVLVSSGGLGREVSLLLRAATLPGAGLALPLLTSPPARRAGTVAGGALRRLGRLRATDVVEIGAGFGSLADGEARQAFLHTLRAVVEPAGQRISAVDRLYLAEAVPSLVVWGARDPIIPAAHARVAHAAMPGSRLAVLEDAGHFPQLEQPEAFAAVLGAFLAETAPAAADAAALRERVLAGPPAPGAGQD
jgi:pimeloyl-ACP methyl ester carboxylesterase